MRTYTQIFQEFCDWLVKKTGDKKYDYQYMLETDTEENINSFLYKTILELCYDKENGLYYFAKFIIGDLLELGYPSPYRYSSLIRKWDMISKKNKKLAVLSARGHGKLNADSVPVPTPSGYKNHGDLKIGDKVFKPDGTPVTVTGISDKLDADYVVEFTNGEKIRCHDNHEWKVYDYNKERQLILETKQMFKGWKQGNRSRYMVDNFKALEFSNKKLPLDPYYMGLWLGDGSKDKTTITHSKEDIASINSIPYTISKQWVHKTTGVVTTSFASNGIIKELRNLTLYNNKHIPDIYLMSTIKQRLELLAGLIDSDGSVSKKRGRVRFVNTNKKIIDGVYELVTYLGMKPYITQQPPHSNGKGINGKLTTYTVNFNPTMIIPTRLERKKITIIPKQKRIGIKSIKYLPNGEQGHCIMVDSDDGMYLVGKKPIPTHNSLFFSIMLNLYDMFLFSHRRVILISASQEQANRILNDLKTIVENNEWLIEKKSSKRWANETIGYNDGYILVKGIGSEILGEHVDRIVVDDILRNDNKLSDTDIEDYIDMTLDPMLLNRKGQMIVVGTSKSATDIFSTIKRRVDEGSIWSYDKFPAILDYENKILQCPDRFTWDQIMEKRLSMGHLKFAREYQLEFFSRGTTLFQEEVIKRAKEMGEDCILVNKIQNLGPNWVYVGSADVARSGKASADFTVVFILAYNTVTQEKRIVHMWRSKGMKISEQARHIAGISRDFDHPYFLVEQNNMGQDMIDELIDVHNMNVEGYITGGRSQKKEELIRFLITAFEHEQIVLPRGNEYSRGMTDIIVGELEKFSVTTTHAGNEQYKALGGHDDTIISLAILNRATQMVAVPFAVVSEGGRNSSGYNPYDALYKNSKESALMNMIKNGSLR